MKDSARASHRQIDELPDYWEHAPEARCSLAFLPDPGRPLSNDELRALLLAHEREILAEVGACVLYWERIFDALNDGAAGEMCRRAMFVFATSSEEGDALQIYGATQTLGAQAMALRTVMTKRIRAGRSPS